MRNVWEVARQEFISNVRKKSFLWAAFGIPVFLGFIFTVVVLVVTGGGDLTAASVGVVDNAEIIRESVEVPEEFVLYESEQAARSALDNEELKAYVVIPENYLRNGQVQAHAYGAAPQLEDTLSDYLLLNLSADLQADVPQSLLEEPVDLTVHLQDSGREVEQDAAIGLFIVPFIFMMIIFVSLQIASTFLMNSIVTEKSNRLMEILITSIRPFELLAGKVLGAGALGLLQIIVWVGIALVLALLGNAQADFVPEIVIPTDLILLSLVYFLLSYFLFGSILAGIGAVVGSEEESRQIAGFFTFPLVLPFFFIAQLFTEPNAPILVILTLIPFTAPITVILRAAIGGIPPEQLIASISIMVITMVIIMWASARIFRWALLLYGKQINLKTIWYVLTRSPEIGTIPAEQQEQTS